jgi:hypothetical protein
MRADVPTALTALALTAGLVLLVGAVTGSGSSAATAKVVEMEPVRLVGKAFRIIGVDAEKFLLSTDSLHTVINASAPDQKPHMMRDSHWYGDLVAWDEQKSTLYFAESGLMELDVTDWDNPMAKHPGSYIAGSSFARASGVSYIGTNSGQVFAISDGRTVEQKFNGGRVDALVVVGGSVVAFVRGRDEETSGTLFLLDGEELTVIDQRAAGDVQRLLAVDDTHFLLLDGRGMHVGSTDGNTLAVQFEIEGVKSLSRDAHDGFFVLSTTAATRLVRLVDGRLTTVRTLDRRPMHDAAFNGEVLGVIYVNDNRKIALYRVTTG